MAQLKSAQGVFDALLMFLDGTETDVDTNTYTVSLQAFGTHPAGMAVRLIIPAASGPTTEDNDITFSVHGSLTEDGAAVDGTPVFSKVVKEDTMDTITNVETLIPFVLPSEVGWIVFKIAQTGANTDDLSGIIAGIVTDLGYKGGHLTRVDPWQITKDIP